MEKELNIAAILEDKPKNIKLWSPMLGECKLKEISNDGTITVEDFRTAQYYFDYKGRFDGTMGETILFPSKLMRDWSKFAWKKGDVLCSNTGDSCIFVKWISDDYTSFLGYYSTHNDYEKEEYQTAVWSKKTSKEDIWQYILAIEAIKNGTLNLETLEIEQPKQEFKDGDIVTFKRDGKPDITIILKRADFDYIDQLPRIHYHAMYDYQTNKLHKELGYIDKALRYNGCLTMEGNEFILATDSEKQQLFSALAKENKAWDAEKKMLLDLPKKCGFKTMDWCLMRDHREKWKLCQFGFFDKGDEYEASYNAVGGNWYHECIPYNDQTAHLLGTTDEWKGGEG